MRLPNRDKDFPPEIDFEEGAKGVQPSGPTEDPGFHIQREKAKDATRRWLAFSLVGLLAIVVIYAEVAFVFGWIDGQDLPSLTVVVSPVSTLSAVAIGYFFSKKED